MALQEFSDLLEAFQRRLSSDDINRFQSTTFEELQDAVMKIQEEQAKRRGLRNMNKIRPFFNSIQQYAGVIEVFVNARPDIMAFIWGPIKFCLQVSSRLGEAFDALLDAYKMIGDSFPILSAVDELFYSHSHVKQILTNVYEDLLNFHKRAIAFFKERTWKLAFKVTFHTFSDMFADVFKNLSRSKELLLQSANIAHYQESQEARILFAKQFETQAEVNRSQQILTVMRWLSPELCTIQHEELKDKRRILPSASRWIFATKAFRSWLWGPGIASPIFWLSGIPGAGKTFLFSSVVDEIIGGKFDAQIIFFYCKNSDPHRNTFDAVARSAIAQILHLNSSCLDYLYEKAMSKSALQATVAEEYTEILKTIAMSHDSLVVGIDGLDECDEAERRKILFMITQMLETKDKRQYVKFFLTSRRERDITSSLRSCTNLHIEPRDVEKDIIAYVEVRSQALITKLTLPTPWKKRIQSEVSSRSQGMFLLARLIMDNLENQDSLEDLEEELDSNVLPRGINDAYGRILARLARVDRPEKSRKRAAFVLELIATAVRPLKVHEIQGALSINLQSKDVEFERRRSRIPLDELCGPIIEIQFTGTVNFVHRTARDYLLQHHSGPFIFESRAKIQMAELCTSYLTFHYFNPNLMVSEVSGFVAPAKYSFQEYAVSNWIQHMRDVDISQSGTNEGPPAKLEELCKTILASHHSDCGESLAISNVTENGTGDTDLFTGLDQISSIYSTTGTLDGEEAHRDGLPYLLHQIATVRSTVEESVTCMDTTRSEITEAYGDYVFKCPTLSCQYYHQGFRSRFERDNHQKTHKGRIRCTYEDCDYWYLGFRSKGDLDKHLQLCHSSLSDTYKFPQVKRVSIDKAIKAAIDENDHQAVCELSAESLRTGSVKGHELLLRALRKGSWKAASVLVKTLPSGQEINNKLGGEVTVLEFMTRIRFQTDLEDDGRIEVDVRSGTLPYYHRSIASDAENDLFTLFKLILEEKELNVNATDDHGRTSLSMVAGTRNLTVARLLLARDDIDTNASDKLGRTPLHWAAITRDENIAQLLLMRNDIDVNVKENEGKTPLCWAAANGCESIGQKLIARGDVDINARDASGRTPLSYFAARGSENIISLLLRRDEVIVDLKDNDGRTAFSHCAANGSTGVASLLLKRNEIDVNAKDVDERTPLYWAVFSGSESIVELLVGRNDVDINAADAQSQTPLSWAASGVSETILSLLLTRNDIDINATDWMFQSSLFHAVDAGNERAVQLLLSRKDIIADAKDHYGWTPLHYAASSGLHELGTLLLERGDVNPNVENMCQRTPLSEAVLVEDEKMVRLLLTRDDLIVDHKDLDGLTPLSWASILKNETIIELLVQRGASVKWINRASNLSHGEKSSLIVELAEQISSGPQMQRKGRRQNNGAALAEW